MLLGVRAFALSAKQEVSRVPHNQKKASERVQEGVPMNGSRFHGGRVARLRRGGLRRMKRTTSPASDMRRGFQRARFSVMRHLRMVASLCDQSRHQNPNPQDGRSHDPSVLVPPTTAPDSEAGGRDNEQEHPQMEVFIDPESRGDNRQDHQ